MANIPFLNNAYFAGKVGIGTASPEVKLDVRGQLLVAGDTPVSRIGSTLEVYRNGTTAELSIHQDSSTVSSSLFSQLRFRNGGNDTYLKVPQNGNGFIIDVESQANAFVIGITGNVGIGTTSPSEKLHVNGEVRVDGNDGVATKKVRSSYFSCTQNLDLVAGSSADIILTSDKVGIGTTSPSQKLEVSGNSLVAGTQFIGDTFTKIQQASGNLLLTNQSSSGAIAFLTNSTERVRVDSSGNLSLIHI